MNAAGLRALEIHDDVHRAGTLTGTSVVLTGRAELHLSGAGDPLPGSVVHLNSPDAWLFLHQVKPSQGASSLLGRIRVEGAQAVAGSNVRVVQHGTGAVVIPHAPDFVPLEVFDEAHFTGSSKSLSSYTGYSGAFLGPMNAAIRSFRLKRGYMATFAQNANGTGASRCIIAQDGDIEMGVLPPELDRAIRFVRVFPWRWVGKKGICGNIENNLNVQWTYNWNLNRTSTLDWEYVPIRQNRWWPGLDQDWKYRGATHLLGHNEPDHHDQANMTVAEAIADWPNLLATGLRVGSPAVTDGGRNWLYNFMDQAGAANLRVDYVVLHYYRCHNSPGNPAAIANQFYNFIKEVHDRVKRPIWVKEWNNGANWTSCADPTFEQQRAAVAAMIEMLDSTPFVERYSIYNWVEDVRRVKWDDGSLTPAGEVYRDKVSPIAYIQELPDAGTPASARYSFDGHLRDVSGNGHEGSARGTPSFTTGRSGLALTLDGTDDYLQLPPKLGDSTDFSFTAWVKWDGGGNWQRIFDLGSDTANFIYLTPKSSSNQLRFNIRRNGTDQHVSSSALTPGVWTHVAVTLGGNTGKLFVNGDLVATNASMTFNPIDLGTRFNWIGRGQFADDSSFGGSIDDVRFHAHALSDAEVAAIAAALSPQFAADPLSLPGGVKFQPYTGDIAGSVSGGGELSFAKLGGPAWLAVAPNGRLTGVPGLGDGGLNRFRVQVSNSAGLIGTAELEIRIDEPDGLIVRYAFDGNADATAGTAHGNPSGSPTYTAGRFGQAIDLDGTDDFVTLPPTIASHDEITVAAWVRWDGGGNWQRIFDFGNGEDEHLFLTPRSSTGRVRFSIENGGVTQFIEGPAALPSGQWVHVAATIGAGTGRLYLNGSQVADGAMSFKPSDFAPASNFIGKSQFPDPLFDGRIDEFVIFNHALTAPQINALRNDRAPAFSANPLSRPEAAIGEAYDHSIAASASDPDEEDSLVFFKVSGPAWLAVAPDGRISGVPSAPDAGLNRFIVRATDSRLLASDTALEIVVASPPDLVAHYEFDGNSNDRAGTNHGVNGGGPIYQAAVFDRGIRLDGVDDFVTLPAGFINGLTDVTLAVRVRWDGGGSWQRILDFGNNTNQFLCLTPRSGNVNHGLRFTIKNGGGEQQLNHSAPLPTDEWSHVAVTLSGNTGTLYLNGAAVDTQPITIAPAHFSPALNYLGKSLFAADPHFNGVIDDFRIFGRSLSPGEISALAVPPPAVIVPDHGYAAWAADIPFPTGQDGPDADPDDDGIVNLLEYLFDTDPLASGENVLPRASVRSVAGLETGKTYLCLEARVRKNRRGITLVPQAAATLEGLSLPEAAGRALPVGPPQVDGNYEIHTWYYEVAVEDALRGKGFMRLKVVTE